MPSQVLHTLFGEDLAAEISSRLKPEFESVTEKVHAAIKGAHKGMFALGCQGPDIFYHSRGRRPVGLEYGALLHRRGAGAFTAELLEISLEGLRREDSESESLVAYALGFMTHAMLDRAAHPYIIYKSACLSQPNPEALRIAHSHAFFERIIDVLMLKLLRGMEISEWDQEGLLSVTCENQPAFDPVGSMPGIKGLLAQALVRAFPERAGNDEKLLARIENTFYDCAYFYRLTAPSQTAHKRLDDYDTRQFPLKKRHLIYLFPEELPPDVDFLNLAKQPWFYPIDGSNEDYRSFPELYVEAVKSAATSFTGILRRYLEEGSFPLEETAGAIGNAGLSIVDKAGEPCAPRRTGPLPLDEVMEQQAVLRGLS